jgi:hypothetical protein
MRGYRRRRVTPYSAATPMRPDKRLRACYRYGGVGAPPALPLLPDTHGIAFVAPPWICGAHPPQVGPALVTRPARVLR